VRVKRGNWGISYSSSLGGWSQVVSAQRKGQKMEYDERSLGSGDFVTAIFK
jgi:hypothetical protein